MNAIDEWTSLDELATDPARNLPLDELGDMVGAAIGCVGGAEDGSVTIVGSEDIPTVGMTSSLAVAVEAVQREEGEGPCLTAALGWRTYVIDDVTTEDRWPRFSKRVSGETEMRSLLARAIPGEAAPRGRKLRDGAAALVEETQQQGEAASS